MIYEGEYLNGVVNGKGKCKYHDGVVHEGEYKDGKANGKGTRTYLNGTKVEGNFVDGQYVEETKFFWE